MANIALCLAIICFISVEAGEIDNKLTGLPIVDCQDVAVSLTFNTEKPFTGRVYVKGLVEDDRCSRNFATNADQSKFSMQIPQGDCNMQRQRVSGALEGIMFSLVIVVSFHGTFETKNDRAFRCMCFFRNIKRVTNFLDVSNLGTTELLDTAKTATCFYTIHSESATGPLTKYAKVGDKIYHAWECDDPNQGILVHSCWVNDGRGNRFDLLDIDGCAIDPVIQPDVKYEESLLKASVETWAYKFSDTSVLDYQCVVELCKKPQGECNGLTPPVCGRGKRSARAVVVSGKMNKSVPIPRPSADSEMDLVAQMNVLDTIDESVDDVNGAGVPEDLLRQLNAAKESSAADSQRMCMSAPTFGILLSFAVVLLLTVAMTTGILCFRLRTPTNDKLSYAR